MTFPPAGRRVGPDCLSDARLDALVCGLAPAAVKARADAHLASCEPCRRRYAELREFAASMRGHMSDAAIAAQAARAAKPRARWMRPAAAGATALCAAALILLVVRAGDGRPDAGIRTKGSDFFSVQVLRRGQTFLGTTGAPYYPGDTLQFAIPADRPRHVAVFDREASGAVTVFHPWRGHRSAFLAPLATAGEHILDPPIALDETRGREWLVAVACGTPFDTAIAAERLSDVSPDAVGGLAAGDLDLPAGCTVQTFELDKRPEASQ